MKATLETVRGVTINCDIDTADSPMGIMESCEEISSKRFGQIPVVRNSYACDRDRRISNNRVLDRLLDTNRVDHYVQHVPVWETKKK